MAQASLITAAPGEHARQRAAELGEFDVAIEVAPRLLGAGEAQFHKASKKALAPEMTAPGSTSATWSKFWRDVSRWV